MRKPPEGKLFVPGQSGNPGGRPRIPDDVKALARSYTREAIETAAEIMRNDEETGTARMSAVNTILDRAWGKAPQHITTENLGSLTDADIDAELAAAIDELRRGRLNRQSAAADGGGEAPTTAH